MKNIIIGVLITVLIFGGALAGCGVVQDKGVEQNGELEVDYPVGDTNPEHLAEVLGSYERYEELRDSKLRKPDTEMQLAYDTYGAEQRKIAWVFLVMRGEIVKIERKVITALSRGEIVKIEGRVMTIANEGDTISLYVPEFADIYTHRYMGVTEDGEAVWLGEKLKVGDLFPQGEEIEFKELDVGDWLWGISVAINADDAQARAIDVASAP